MLEHFHASLKLTIKKVEINKNEWDAYLKFLLLAYHNTPHTVTGYSPFEIIYDICLKPIRDAQTRMIEGNMPENSLHDSVE